MSAVKYFKDKGLSRVRSDLQIVAENGFNSFFTQEFVDELKRLVKSHEMVASWGGLADAKVAVKVSRHKKYLKKAIADVESCTNAT